MGNVVGADSLARLGAQKKELKKAEVYLGH